MVSLLLMHWLLPSRRMVLPLLALLVTGNSSFAFDYEGHRTINELALATLPKDFPEFVRTVEATERVAFLAGEPDRWRNSSDPTFRHFSSPDHYFDLDELVPLGMAIEKLPAFRHVFTAQVATARARNRERLTTLDPDRDDDQTRDLIGYLPWTIAEEFSRLRSAFSSLRAYEEAGTPDEIANARANVIHYMGVLGHYVGDAAQPLHTTSHFNGWTGANPNGFTRSRGFHSWVDGGYVSRAGLKLGELKARLRMSKLIRSPNEAVKDASIFPQALAFIREQHRRVVPLYQLEKEGKLSPKVPADAGGRTFFETQFLSAAQMLGDLWLTAWREAPPDQFLLQQLARRKLASDRSQN